MFGSRRLPTILVVDDEESVTQLCARILEREGYHVLTAATAETGLQEVADSRPDAIILDLRLPDIDGLEFLRRLRARDTQTPVVVVTGDYSINRDDTVLNDLRALDAGLMFKPLGREDLIALVRRLTASG